MEDSRSGSRASQRDNTTTIHVDPLQHELAMLRREVRETRTAALAALLAVAGRPAVWETKRIAIANDREERERLGTPLSDLGITGRPHDRLAGSHHHLGQLDCVTLEELVEHVPREQVAALDGIGDGTLATLDAAVAERDLRWLSLENAA